VGQDPICVFGGAFDPVHIGHLMVAQDVREKKGFERILFVPCNLPPTKESTGASAEERIDMLSLATTPDPAFELSDMEVRREGRSYTVDTLEETRSEFGSGRPIFLLVGMDQLNVIESWHRPERIVQLCTILAVHRPGAPPGEIPEMFRRRVEMVDARLVDVSSSEIRERIRRGLSIKYLVTDAVESYIYERGLYGAAGKGS
jgi:nicotinate-nucleotide adenylyltransferase